MATSTSLVDIDVATTQLGISRPTLYRWLRTGRIKGVKIGRQWRVEEAELKRLAAGEGPPVEPTPGLDALLDALADLARQQGLKPPPDTPPEAPLEATPPESSPDAAPEAATPADVAARDIIRIAAAVRASDIHLETRCADGADRAYALLRFRVDGVMVLPIPFDLRALPAVVNRFKAMAACNVNESSKPQDGRIMLNVDGHDLDLRICSLPTALGETATLRILDRGVACLTIDRFDYSRAQTDRLTEALAAPNGLILCTGPTGSGKTTTLYACLNQLASPQRRVMTIEDPVEYLLSGMTQTGINARNGLTFAAAMRAALRSDPDVIMVGEVRDRETAEICSQAALTGHVVLSTLHTNDAAATLMRLIGIGVAPFVVADAVRLVIAQRLLRALCNQCKQPAAPDADHLARAKELAESGGLSWDALPQHFHRPVGCPHCAQTGYRGRKVVTEMLMMTPAVRAALCDNPTEQTLRRRAIEAGMTTLLADAARRAAEGQTTLAEVSRIAAQFG